MPSTTKSIQIHIVDDHLLFAEGIKEHLLRLAADINITLCTEGSQYLSLFDSTHGIDLIIMDIYMPDVDCLELIPAIRTKNKNTPILIISAATDQGIIDQAIQKGANAFLSKSSSPTQMLTAARELIPDGHHRTLASDDADISNDFKKTIAPRTFEVLQLLARGESNKTIADLMSITEATVKWHVTQLFDILEVSNRTSCALKATNSGLIHKH